ncbi:hypothetical protein RJT34_29296 [Clitoria ternatea]|uniref:WRKY domain-containing protein n=1 Tax=Clitoria ternatea TaxID=43366 RepID=A0AAN9FG24_CLITE
MEEELIRGRDMANQLLEVVLAHAHAHAHGEGDKEGSLAEDLVREVLSSFTNTLLLLNSNNHHLPPITINHVSSFTNCPKLQIKDETCKTNNTKSRRRCYNRKSYYRCTHKSDEGCQAIKQVQRIQEKPPLYRTTYYGHHSCKNNLNPEITLQPVSPSSSSSVILNFNSPFSSSLLAPTKQEPVEVIHNDHAQTQEAIFSRVPPFSSLRDQHLSSKTYSREASFLRDQHPMFGASVLWCHLRTFQLSCEVSSFLSCMCVCLHLLLSVTNIPHFWCLCFVPPFSTRYMFGCLYCASVSSFLRAPPSTYATSRLW